MQPYTPEEKEKRIQSLRDLIEKHRPKPGKVRSRAYLQAMASLHYYDHPEIRARYRAKQKKKMKSVIAIYEAKKVKAMADAAFAAAIEQDNSI